MSASSWNKYDFFNAGLGFTPEVFIQCVKKYGSRSGGAGDREFYFTSLKFYCDITCQFWFLTFYNLRSTSYSIQNRINSFGISCASKMPLKRRILLWPLKCIKNWNVMVERKKCIQKQQFFLYGVILWLFSYRINILFFYN